MSLISRISRHSLDCTPVTGQDIVQGHYEQITDVPFLLLFTGMASLPIEVYEAAKVDGASGFQRFIYVTLPMLKPIILVAVVVRVIDTLRIFDTIFVLTRGGPANMTEVLSIYTYKIGMNFFRIGYATTMSYFLLFIIMIIAMQFVNRLERQGD